MFSGEAKILRSSGFRLGCPVASVALDVASTTETVRKPCADVFATWINALAEGIAASGTPRETATDLASYILASLEGAIILSRTSKSVKSLAQTAQFVLRTIQETIRETIEEKLPRRSHKARVHAPVQGRRSHSGRVGICLQVCALRGELSSEEVDHIADKLLGLIVLTTDPRPAPGTARRLLIRADGQHRLRD